MCTITSNRPSSKQANNDGSVLLEFAIVLPLLLVFFLGISGIGQLLGHVTWISQTTYAAAMFAADVPQPDGAAKVELETNRLSTVQNRGQVSGQWDAPVYFNGEFTGKPIVSVSVPAHVTPLLNSMFGADVGVSVAAPYLVPNQSGFAAYGDYGNPPGTVTCVGAACNPVLPYNPGIKGLGSIKLTNPFSAYSEDSDAVYEAIKNSVDSDPDSYLEAVNKYADWLNNNEDLAKAVAGLAPTEKPASSLLKNG